ncbi:MAG: histidine kinase [Actinomycetes bacterium]
MADAAAPDGNAHGPGSPLAVRQPVAAFRAVLLLLCVVLALIPEGVNTAALARIAVLAVVAAVITRFAWRRRAALPAGLLECVLTGAFVDSSGGTTSPLLPYLLASGLALGLASGWQAAVGGGVAATVVATLLRLPGGDETSESIGDYIGVVGTWALLGAAVGILASAALAMSTPAPTRADRYAEAHALLQQLRSVSARLPGGLDAPSAASALLRRCGGIVPLSRSAVLVQRGGEQLVPIAVQGTRRVPWRAPLTAPGPLRDAWESRASVVDIRKADRAGRRRGSALAAVPLVNEGTPFGLVVLESLDLDAFAGEWLEQVTEVTDESALQIETALLFEEVRATATLEERDRLARQMHDGMAQDIAFLGYQLDALRSKAAAVDPELEAGLLDVRGRLTSLISDIRLSITDLRTSVDTERGLGGAISSYVRAIGAGKDTAVHLSLQESTFRLAGDAEVLLFRVVQAVAQDMRRNSATHLWVTLVTDPPSARVLAEHDGPMSDEKALGLQEHAASVTKYGGSLTVSPGRSGGPCVVVELGGGEGAGHGAAGR